MIDSDVEHALELLADLGPVRARPMMGGHIFHCGTLPVALLYDEQLYLKVDATTLPTFEAAGGEPFTYELSGRVVQMSYCTPPVEALESADSMVPWARLALEAAERSRVAPRRRSRPGRKVTRGRGAAKTKRKRS